MSNNMVLMDVLFPAQRQRVLAVLLLQPQSAFHLRELSRLTASHAGTLARELDKLTATGLLLRTEQGNQVRYQADSTHPLFEDLAAMFRKTHGLVPALRTAIAALDAHIQLAFVFGSMANGMATSGSDIDLFVLGNMGFGDLAHALYPLHSALRREVNPVLYTAAEFTQKVRQGDAFACDILAKPKLWVKGRNDDLAELVGHPAPASP